LTHQDEQPQLQLILDVYMASDLCIKD